jgi:transcriptional regulator of nitric oxide reductase
LSHFYIILLWCNWSLRTSRSFREYGEAVLQLLENHIESDPKLQKAPVNYEGVSLTQIKIMEDVLKCLWLVIWHQVSCSQGITINSLLSLFPFPFLKQVRASGFGGWFLLRLSLHDPVLPLNIEVENILSFSASTATVISLYIATKSNCASGN